jgi:hypothetical protein
MSRLIWSFASTPGNALVMPRIDTTFSWELVELGDLSINNLSSEMRIQIEFIALEKADHPYDRLRMLNP